MEMPITDLTSVAADKREREAERIAGEEARLPFDLAGGPLLRARLLRLSEDEHVLLVTMHHIVSDGWSMGVLVREVAALYSAFSQGQPAPLEELPIAVCGLCGVATRVAAWGSVGAATGVLARTVGRSAAVLELPSDHPRPAVQSFRGS